MRQQELNRPEQESIDDRQIYRFKTSYSRMLSQYLLISILAIALLEIELVLMDAIGLISLRPPFHSPLSPSLSFAKTIFGLLLTVPGLTYLLARFLDLRIDPLAFGFNRINISRWQDIITVKFCHFLWIRYISIESKIGKRTRNIALTTSFYNLPPILDRVREYAGADHPLTIALEKEVLLPRQKPFKVIWRIIAGFALILTVWLVGGNLYADYRERPLEQAIASYIRQHPKTPPNQSAIELQILMAKLGLATNQFGDGSKPKIQPEQSALAEYGAIDPILTEYLDKQLDKPEGSIEKVPTKVRDYLTKYRSTISAIQELLATKDLPNWGDDPSWLERDNPDFKKRYDALGSSIDLSKLKLSRLLIAELIDRQGKVDKDNLQPLVAIQNFSRPSSTGTVLIEQLVSLVKDGEVNKLFRHTELTPTGWQGNEANPDRERMMKSSIEYELAMIARATVQFPELLDPITEGFSPLKLMLRYRNLARPYLRVVAATEYQHDRARLDYLTNLNICRADDGESDKFPDFPGLYIRAKTSNLDRELTTSVREIKSQLKAGVAADKIAKEFKLASSTCADENWTAKVKDGEVTISLGQPPKLVQLKIGNNTDIDRFTYRIDAAKT